jgi:hypothetical protein
MLAGTTLPVSENGLEADRERFDPFVTERKSINSLERVKGIEPSC